MLVSESSGPDLGPGEGHRVVLVDKTLLCTLTMAAGAIAIVVALPSVLSTLVSVGLLTYQIALTIPSWCIVG